MPIEPTIYTDHPLTTALLDPDAIKIVRRLRSHGYEAYLVGGCVRDLVLGIEPKDFDVATSATPREVRGTFRNCRVIGRRFRLCHIFFQQKIIEVATFRTEPLAKLEEDAPDHVDAVERALPRHEAPTQIMARPAGRESHRERERERDPEQPSRSTSASTNARRTDASPAGPAPRSIPTFSPSPRPSQSPTPAPQAPLPPAAPVAAPAPPAIEAGSTLGGLNDDEYSGFASGLIDVPAPRPKPPAPAPPPAPPPPPPAPEVRITPPPIAPPREPALAPWEVDDAAETREMQAIEGRRAVVDDEVAEVAAEVEEAADAIDEVLVDDVLSEIGEPIATTARERHPDAAPPSSERRHSGDSARGPGPRPERRKARWEKLLDEEEPPQGYGTADEDARLRDFSINALFYDPIDERIVDFVDGMRDLRGRVLRAIGEPVKRMVEDPVRIMRAVKSAAKLDLEVEPATWHSLVACSKHLAECAARRILEEILKLLASGAAAKCFRMLAETGALAVILPELVRFLPIDGPCGGAPLSSTPPGATRAPCYLYLEALDRTKKTQLTPPVLVAALFYWPILEAWRREGLELPGHPREETAEDARREARTGRSPEARAEDIADEMVREFSARHSLSKKTRADATRIVLAQRLLRRPRGRRMRAARLVTRDWFDDALTLLRICVGAEGAEDEVCRSWEGRAAAVRAGEQEPIEEVDAGSRPPPTRAGVTDQGLARIEHVGGEDGRPRRRRRGGRGRGRNREREPRGMVAGMQSAPQSSSDDDARDADRDRDEEPRRERDDGPRRDRDEEPRREREESRRDEEPYYPPMRDDRSAELPPPPDL